MSAKCIMIQGTASNVGKSILCAALCRIFYQDGFRVAPFKSQNMALNSYVTAEGLEIGRAQGVQAEAAGITATADMNPILLKPKQDSVAQVIVHGRPFGDMGARQYRDDYVPRALAAIKESLGRLQSKYDILVIEGAGSPAEINLKDRDIANMKIAQLAEAPVLLVADIDRGGAFASIVGTLELLTPAERHMVAGIVINKFGWDRDILQPGLDFLEQKTGIPVLGVIPYFPVEVDPEDSLALDNSGPRDKAWGQVNIAVIRLPRISNFTDFSPLASEPDTNLYYVSPGQELDSPDALIIPGTKNTVADLLHLRETGLEGAILELAARGIPVVGICGGYQMLGTDLYDPHQVEWEVPHLQGMGLLPSSTTFHSGKITHQVKARLLPSSGPFAPLAGEELEGYEIHAGLTTLEEGGEPLLEIVHRQGGAGPNLDGAVSKGGAVFGTHLHGLFDNDLFRRHWLNYLRSRKGLTPLAFDTFSHRHHRQKAYDQLAAVVRENLDLERIYKLFELDSGGANK